MPNEEHIISSSSSDSSISSDSSQTLSTSSSSSSDSSSSVSSSSLSSVENAPYIPFTFRGVLWNRSKSIKTQTASPNSTPILNMICQSLEIRTDTYEFDKVSCYLGSRLGTDISYNLHLDVYEASSEGLPLSLVQTSSIPASSVSGDGWYPFPATVLETPIPASRKLAFVFYQDGGTEDDYVPWFYTPDNENDAFESFFSRDGGTSWNEVEGAVRSMRLLSSVDIFSEAYLDSSINEIITEGGVPASVDLRDNDYLADGDMTDTELISTSGTGSSSSEESSEHAGIRIHNEPLLMSFAMDDSGSMGWKDRNFKRKVAIEASINSLKSEYPAEVLFDITRFGSITLEDISFSMKQNYSTIKIDIDHPDVVTNNLDGTTPSFSDGILSFGLENLEEEHTYIISSIYAGNVVLEDGEGFYDPDLDISRPLNYQSIGYFNSPLIFSVDDVGTGSETGGAGSSAIIAQTPLTGATEFRKPLGYNRPLAIVPVVSPLLSGSYKVEVSDSTIFTQGQSIDIAYKDGVHSGHIVSSIDGNILTLEKALTFSSGIAESSDGTIVCKTSGLYSQDLDLESTIHLLIKDAQASREITFFIQTAKGGEMKWNFEPFLEWEAFNLFWADKVADISVSLFDELGDPLPNGTEVVFYVDRLPHHLSYFLDDEALYSPVYNIEIGDDTFELDDVSTISVGDTIALIGDGDGNKEKGYTVTEVDLETNIITFSPANNAPFIVNKVEITPRKGSTIGEPVYATFSAIDTTPPNVKRNLPISELEERDKPPIPYYEIDIDSYNQSEPHRRDCSFDMPLIDGHVFFNILPVTEDVLSAPDDKKNKAETLLNSEILTARERAIIESQEADYEEVMGEFLDSSDDESSSSMSEETSSLSSGAKGDYSITTPVRLKGGTTNSSMKTWTDEMEMLHIFGRSNLGYNVFSGEKIDFPEGLMSKEYRIHPVVLSKNSSGKIISVQMVPEFPVYFASRYHVFSETEPGVTVTYKGCECVGPLGSEVIVFDVTVPGFYASSKDSISINYLVFDRWDLLPSGTLKISILDTTRDAGEMIEPSETNPHLRGDICECGTDNDPLEFSLAHEERMLYNRISEEIFIEGQTYANTLGKDAPEHASYLEGYFGTYEIPVVKGRASISLSVPDGIIAKIQVLAEFTFPEDPKQSVIKPNPIWTKNPLEIGLMVPTEAPSGEDREAFEIQAIVLYHGVPVEDNVEVNFSGTRHNRFISTGEAQITEDSQLAGKIDHLMDQLENPVLNLDERLDPRNRLISVPESWPETYLSPSVSKTIDGVAAGVFIGPHGTVTNHFSDDPDNPEMLGDKERIRANVHFNGFLERTSNEIMWMGVDDVWDFLYIVDIYINGRLAGGEATIYADGWDYAIGVADLGKSIDNGFPFLEDLYDNLMGFDGSNGRAASMSFGGGGKWSIDRPIDPISGRSMGVGGDFGFFEGFVGGEPYYVNKFIPPRDGECKAAQGCCSPNCEELWSSSNAMSTVEKIGIISGEGTGSQSFSLAYGMTADETVEVKRPILKVIEPLGAVISYLSTKGVNELVRDGVTPVDIIVEVSFSGRPIPLLAREKNVLDSSGNFAPMPVVVFDIFYKRKIYNERGTGIIGVEEVRDSSLTLDNYQVLLGLSLSTSTKKKSWDYGHYHNCSVSPEGSGHTTGTFKTDTLEEIPNHNHTIKDYIYSTEDYNEEAHSHKLLSVARTTIHPISNLSDEICIRSVVSYDASRRPVKRTLKEEFCSDGAGSDLRERVIIRIEADDIWLAQESVTQDYPSLPVKVTADLYTDEGELEPLEDGTRIQIKMEPIRSFRETGIDTDYETGVLVFNPRKVHSYAKCNIEASLEYKGLTSVAERKIEIPSKLMWMPDVRALTPEFTADDIYLNKALTQGGLPRGSSQLHDSIYLSASRMLQKQVEEPEYRNSKKMIMLLTDGDENLSVRSFTQAIRKVNSLRGDKKTPILPVIFGSPFPSDKAIMDKYRDETGGAGLSIISQTDQEIKDDIKELLLSSTPSFNRGTYSNIINLGLPKQFESLSIDIAIPSGAYSRIRIRTGDNLETMGSWSSWVEVGEGEDIPLSLFKVEKIRTYLEYEMLLHGNDSFESPVLRGITASYIEPKVHLIIFKPILLDLPANEFVNEIVITHQATIPDSSEVEYGVCQSSGNYEPDFFISNRQVREGGRTVLFPRTNEIATTVDRKAYSLINGPWPKDSEISVYRINSNGEEEVDSNRYLANPVTGKIIFEETQGEQDSIVCSVNLPSVLSLMCKISNLGEDAASLGAITTMYSTSKRILRDSQGNIVNSPLERFFELSSSSVSSSSFSDESSSGET